MIGSSTARRQSKRFTALVGAGEALAGNPHEDPGSFLHGKGSRSQSDTRPLPAPKKGRGWFLLLQTCRLGCSLTVDLEKRRCLYIDALIRLENSKSVEAH